MCMIVYFFFIHKPLAFYFIRLFHPHPFPVVLDHILLLISSLIGFKSQDSSFRHQNSDCQMNVFQVIIFLLSVLAVFSSADLSIDGESLVLSINEEGPIKVRRARETGEH
eukprot:NP_504359.1 Uncharacterized protein CELE_Y58A7A.2 [Caenorhabditis elegans]